MALCLVSTMAFGQLNIQSGGNTKEDKLSSDSYGSKVVCNGGTYKIIVEDDQSKMAITVTLGTTAQSAKKSLEQLLDWIRGAKVGDYINLTEGEDRVTIYKHVAGSVMVSYGDAEFCKRIYKAILVDAFLDVSTGERNHKNEMYGFMSQNLLKNALKKI